MLGILNVAVTNTIACRCHACVTGSVTVSMTLTRSGAVSQLTDTKSWPQDHETVLDLSKKNHRQKLEILKAQRFLMFALDCIPTILFT